MDKDKPVSDRPTKDDVTGLPRADLPRADLQPLGGTATQAPGTPAALGTEAAPVSDTRAGLPSRLPAQPFERGDERGGIFRDLVNDDADITGLVAYSIYKQNKLDWLNAFEAEKNRAPDAAELAAYIIGEGTPRRLATYRHLAEATLSGNGPDIGNGTPKPRVAVARRGRDVSGLPAAVMASYALIAVLLIVILLLLAHYTMGPR